MSSLVQDETRERNFKRCVLNTSNFIEALAEAPARYLLMGPVGGWALDRDIPPCCPGNWWHEAPAGAIDQNQSAGLMGRSKSCAGMSICYLWVISAAAFKQIRWITWASRQVLSGSLFSRVATRQTSPSLPSCANCSQHHLGCADGKQGLCKLRWPASTNPWLQDSINSKPGRKVSQAKSGSVGTKPGASWHPAQLRWGPRARLWV